MSSGIGKTTISVTSTELWQKNKKYTVYKILITCGDDTWFLFKRYNEFYHLYEKLKKQVPEMTFKFPGKRLFGNNFDPLFIRSRKEGLDDFLQQILADEKLFLQDDVQDFLQIDKKIHSGSDDSCDAENEAPADLCEGLEKGNVDLGPSERQQVRPSDFEFLKVIGKGSFGKVLMARHKTEGKLYAIKVLQKRMILKKNETRHIMAERNVLVKNLRHPFLAGLHYSFQTADKLYFVLDYINGGELFFHLQRERCFPEARARFYSAELASAIGYLHGQGVVYRDLKPENILLDSEGHLVLTDFGLCKEGLRTLDQINTFCGTPEYLAPEILKKQPYDMSVDWWCLGAVLYEMLHGLPPFYSRDVAEMYDNILHKPLRLFESDSPSARSILQGLLQKQKEFRLGYGEGDFEDIKAHEFFKPIDWDDLLQKRIKPPYAPQLSGQMDLRNIDPEFTKESIPNSITKSQQGGIAINASFIKEAEAAFMGFSYVPLAEQL